MALRRILASPTFIFRVEEDPANVAAGATYRISDVELASRLSFFLWSSIPDDTLLDLAAKNRLRTPAVLEQQVRRMLADPRADALRARISPASGCTSGTCGTSCRTTMSSRTSTTRSATPSARRWSCSSAASCSEDRNVLDLLTADYTFVNERLAKHYGIPYVYGSHFRRVTVTEDARRGLLGKGSLLMVTSHADRTAPVLRGKWILENLMGTPPPRPPGNVPAARGERPRTPHHVRFGRGWSRIARPRRARAATK